MSAKPWDIQFPFSPEAAEGINANFDTLFQTIRALEARLAALQSATPAAAADAGDVTGPAGATDGHLAVFDGATGKLLRDGGTVPRGYEPLTDGDETEPELIFAAGDVIMVEVAP